MKAKYSKILLVFSAFSILCTESSHAYSCTETIWMDNWTSYSCDFITGSNITFEYDFVTNPDCGNDWGHYGSYGEIVWELSLNDRVTVYSFQVEVTACPEPCYTASPRIETYDWAGSSYDIQGYVPGSPCGDCSSCGYYRTGNIDQSYVSSDLDKIRIRVKSSGYRAFFIWYISAIFDYKVSISEFQAASYDHSVVLTWETGDEVDNAGWNIYRGRMNDGEYVQINDSLISAYNSPYEYKDSDVGNGVKYYYKLEDVDLDGTKTMHGPVWAIPSPADIDESRRVDGADLIMLCAAMGSEAADEKADMDDNSIVNEADLEIFNDYYGLVLSGK